MALLDKLNLRLSVDDLYNAFLGLDRRQKILVSTGIAVLAFALIVLAVIWYNSLLARSREDYRDHLDNASRLVGVAAKYENLKDSFEQVDQKMRTLGEDPLSSILYKMGEEVGVKKTSLVLSTANLPKTESPDFQEVGKDVNIQNVQLDQLVNLLDKIARFEELPLSVKRLVIKPDMARKHIMHQVSFTVTTVRPVKS